MKKFTLKNYLPTLLIVFILISLFSLIASGQTPSPTVTPPLPGPAGTSLSSFLQSMISNFVDFKDAFMTTIEGTIGGYFSLFAWIIAWCVAVAYFVQQVMRGQWDQFEIGKYTARFALCLLLLAFCGDINNDGKRGDLVRMFSYTGYYFAFGQSQDEPSGGYINQTVQAQRSKFDENYKLFVENKLMVKINEQDMPVRYPGMTGVQTVAAVYTGQATDEQRKTFESQEFWIGISFQSLNICRSILDIIDFFLLVLYTYGVLVLTLIAPLMVAVFVNRDLSKRFTIPFFWSTFTICIIFPAISQVARYFAYLCANFALASNATPNYTWDPTTYTIVAHGDPTSIILVAILCMIISILILAMSLPLSYSFAQGRLLETMTGIIANTFAGLSSVGLSAYVGAWSTRLSAEGDRKLAEGAEQAAVTRAGYNLEGQQASAENARGVNALLADTNYQSSLTSATGQLESSRLSAAGSYLSSLYSTEANRVGTINGAVTNFKHNLANMSTEEKTAQANNLADLLSKNNDAESKRLAEEIRLHPEKLDLLAENYENVLKGIPIIGSAATTLGLNKDAINSWTRTDGFKTVGRWMTGNPETGAITPPIGSGLLGQKPQNVGGTNSEEIYGTPQSGLYQRSDGTMVNPYTGEVVKNPDPAPVNGGNIFEHGTPSLSAAPEAFRNSLTKSQRQVLDGNMRALQRTMKQDPNFLPTVQKFAKEHHLNSNDLLNFLALESSFNKTNSNPYGYIGLGQVGRAERQSMGWSGDDATDLARLSGMSHSQQLDQLVFPFMEKKLGRKLDGANLATIYAAWGSGHATGNPNYVHMAKDGKRAGAYSKNPGWDVNKDGITQEWEFGVSPQRYLGAGVLFDANGARGQLRVPKPQPTRAPNVATIGSGYAENGQRITSTTQAAVKPVEFANAADAITKINNASSPANQKFLSKKLAADADLTNTKANNYYNYQNRAKITSDSFAEKRINEQNFTNEQISNANTVASIQQQGAQTAYNYQNAAAETLYGYQSRAASITRSGNLQAGEMNYGTSMKVAGLQFRGETEAAAIQKKASIDAMYLRNEASLVNTVGSAISREISNIFERVSRNQ